MSNNSVYGNYILGGETKVGDPRRKHEDRVFHGAIDTAGGQTYLVGIVADGVGGADAGERGAQLAIDTVVREIQNSQDNNIPDLMERAIHAANRAVYNDNEAHEADGMTTLVIAIVHNNRCFIGNVGDSRAYWIQGGGAMLQITRDHNYYNMHGGDPNAEDADVLVNAIGRKTNVYPDLGFYLKGETDAEKALRLGVNGLPLKAGDSIMLCSDGLIKNDPMGQRYAKDSEIVDAIRTESEPNAAAVKMVSAALGRRPDDNVSAVTIQYLTPDLIKTMKSRSAAAKTQRTLMRIGAIAFAVIAVITIVALGIKAAQTPETVTKIITNTAAPTMTPTKSIDPGKARVDYAAPVSSVAFGSEIAPGTEITAGGDGVRIVVGEQGGQTGVMYWFGASSGVVNFDISHMMPTLTSGSLYVQPGSNKTAVSFSRWPGVTASVEGSRMIVQVVPEGIWIYCFEGNCQLDPGADKDPLKIPVGYKRFYSPDQGTADDSVQMTDDEMWAWYQQCNNCLYGTDIISTPTPTSKPVSNPNSPENNSNDKDKNNNSGGGSSAPPSAPPTAMPPQPTAVTPQPTEPPTPVPPTPAPPTPEPPTPVPPTPAPPTPEPPTPEPPTPEPPTPEPPSTEPPSD